MYKPVLVAYSNTYQRNDEKENDMATTTYAITMMDDEGEYKPFATKSKRATAITVAQQARAEHKRSVRVHTSAGTLILEMKARKKQKATKPYTRDVAYELERIDLPEGFVVPNGKRVAYTRLRKGCAILHDFDEQYWVYDVRTNDILATFGTTRQCGRFLADSVSLNDEGAVVVA